ncbi:Cuticlin-1 [Trichinella papuae]|uniref:Cuticlin-1 n=1 Tax=Trichinella papuae TaxID=268474 RepID=A0A0V1MCG7_9BILA|nr:Cuticlin-1 [Trichinella papuae]
MHHLCLLQCWLSLATAPWSILFTTVEVAAMNSTSTSATRPKLSTKASPTAFQTASRPALPNIIITLSLLIEPLACAILLENGLIGEPAIECHPNAVQVTFQTENPFQGHVYVRGHYENEDCRRDYANGKDTIVVTQVHFSRCGVRRQRTKLNFRERKQHAYKNNADMMKFDPNGTWCSLRSSDHICICSSQLKLEVVIAECEHRNIFLISPHHSLKIFPNLAMVNCKLLIKGKNFAKCQHLAMTNPKGLSMITTLIITFHRTFVTATDRAFNVQCFYMEEDKIVTQNMDVSGIPTSDLDMNPPEPTCSYHVLRGGRAGVVVSHGKVGDPVYHRWMCIYPMPVALWMMEKENCSMSLMKMGNCSKDIMILPDLIYLNDMEAGIDTTIFKFADKPHIYFTCQVRLSIKRENKNQICQKPTCSGIGRMRVSRRVKLPTRFSDASNSTPATMKKNVDIDLMASPIVVLDIEDRFPKMSTFDTAAMGDYEFIKKENLNINSSFSQNICMLPMAFNIFISTLIILVLSLLTFVAYVITQIRTYTPQY